MAKIVVEIHIYGELSQYADKNTGHGSAETQMHLEENSTIHDILCLLKMPTEKRGITFINGKLSAMPGLQPDLEHVLKDGDRVAFFDLKSMWPFQYRSGAQMIDEMAQALSEKTDKGVHHSYDEP